MAIGLLSAQQAAAETRLVGAPARWQGWVYSSLVPTPDVDVLVHVERCPWYPDLRVAGCAIKTEAGWEVWVSFQPRVTLMHELGHIFDVEYLTERRRARFADVYGEALFDREHFADLYMTCAVTGTPARVCRLIEGFAPAWQRKRRR